MNVNIRISYLISDSNISSKKKNNNNWSYVRNCTSGVLGTLNYYAEWKALKNVILTCYGLSEPIELNVCQNRVRK